MKGPLAVAVIAALVMYASASPCTELCSSSCNGQKALCELTGVLGDLCATKFNLCSAGCAAVCNCVDTCDAECGGGFATCQETSGPLEVGTCAIEYADCQAACSIECGANTIAGAIDGSAGAK